MILGPNNLKLLVKAQLVVWAGLLLAFQASTSLPLTIDVGIVMVMASAAIAGVITRHVPINPLLAQNPALKTAVYFAIRLGSYNLLFASLVVATFIQPREVYPVASALLKWWLPCVAMTCTACIMSYVRTVIMVTNTWVVDNDADPLPATLGQLSTRTNMVLDRKLEWPVRASSDSQSLEPEIIHSAPAQLETALWPPFQIRDRGAVQTKGKGLREKIIATTSIQETWVQHHLDQLKIRGPKVNRRLKSFFTKKA